MADTVTSQTIQDGQRVAVLKFTNESDGTGESSVKKVDVSALSSNNEGKACTSVSIARIHWFCRGMGVDTSTFLTDDSPVPSDSLVNFNTATL